MVRMLKVDPTTYKDNQRQGGLYSTMDSVLASQPAAPGLIPGVAKVNPWRCCLEQWTAEA